MDTVSAEHFLLDQFPLRLRPTIPTTLRAAYAAADLVIDAEPILKVKSADDNRGRIADFAVPDGMSKTLGVKHYCFD